MFKSNSATSLACLFAGVGLFVIARHPALREEPGKMIKLGIAFIVLFGIMDLAFGLKDAVITLLGRRPDLTTRVPMWEDLLSLVKNPLIGFGYESFWLGDRRQYMNEHWGIVSQAHNGYLEMYLNLGLIGVLFLVIWVFWGLKNIFRHLKVDYPDGIFRLCFLLIIVIYNYTEATFYGVSNLWLLFFVAAMVPGGLVNEGELKTTTKASLQL